MYSVFSCGVELEPLDPFSKLIHAVAAVIPAGFSIDSRTQYKILEMEERLFEITKKIVRNECGVFLYKETIGKRKIPNKKRYYEVKRWQINVVVLLGKPQPPFDEWQLIP